VIGCVVCRSAASSSGWNVRRVLQLFGPDSALETERTYGWIRAPEAAPQRFNFFIK